jgi:hypothetical protein
MVVGETTEAATWHSERLNAVNLQKEYLSRSFIALGVLVGISV